MTYLTVSGYTIHDKIGEGAMSEVYLASSPNNSLVAIKVLRHYLKDDVAFIQRMEREAQNLKLLEDERIVKFIEVVKTNDARLAIVEEYVNGKNLEILFSASGIKIPDTIRPLLASILVSEILLGLEEAHRQGIVHRDLKPENIMVTDRGRIKITDFGVAKNLAVEELSIAGVIAGSPAYMSPEQIRGAPVDERADIFSLGVLLYKLTTNQLPFQGANYSALTSAILNTTPSPPEKINPYIHPTLSKIIIKSLGHELRHRYAKVYQFRYELVTFLDYLGVPSPQKILKAFYDGNLHYLESLTQNDLIKTIIRRADSAIQNGNRAKGLSLLQQIFTIDPHNQEAKKLLGKNGKDRHLRRYVFASMGFIVILFFVFWPTSTFFNHRVTQAPPIPTIVPTTIATTIPATIATVAHPAVAIEPTVKSPSTTIPKIKKVTKIRFQVPDSVILYLDNKKLDRLSGHELIVTPGKHTLMMRKDTYNPIVSEVITPEGETTTINAE